MVRNVWVGHAVAQYVHVNDSDQIQLDFLVQHANSEPPQVLLNAAKTGKPCTVEFLSKLLPDRYGVTGHRRLRITALLTATPQVSGKGKVKQKLAHLI